MYNNSEDKDRRRFIELAKRATAEEVQNHLDAFDGTKIIVDYDCDLDEDSDMDEPRDEARSGKAITSHDHNKAFHDGFGY